MTDARNPSQMHVRLSRFLPRDLARSLSPAAIDEHIRTAWANGWRDAERLATDALEGTEHPAVRDFAALFASRLREIAGTPCPTDDTPRRLAATSTPHRPGLRHQNGQWRWLWSSVGRRSADERDDLAARVRAARPRGRTTELETGHCCAACAQRIGDDLASIVANGDLAAVSERVSGSGAAVPGYESKPPMSLEGLAPYLVGVRLNPGVEPPLVRTVADLLESWSASCASCAGFAGYGPATAHHVGTDAGILAAQASRQAVSVLRGHLEWITADPDFPLDDFADEIRRCAMRMHALMSPTGSRDRIVKCPTLTTTEGATDLTTCGARLTVRTWRCPRLRRHRPPRPQHRRGRHLPTLWSHTLT